MAENWWKNDMAKDIHATIRSQEMGRMPFVGQSPQLGRRRFLIDWVAIIAEKYEICSQSLHLSIYLLDRYMDNFDIHDSQLHLVALSCLLIGAKFEEKDDLIPRVNELNSHVDNAYHNLEFMEMELAILTFFSWKIFIPTAAHFLNYYLMECIGPNDKHAGYPLLSTYQAKFHVEKYASYFLAVSLQDEAFCFYLPSLVASACVAASRFCLKLCPTWTCGLIKITKYHFDEISACLQLLLRAHDIDERAAKKTPVNEKRYSLNGGYSHPHTFSQFTCETTL